jgi:anhydro-N-acetylmuramic acid kinase
MADARLFAHATEWRALQTLGGIGNVTVVPPASATQGGIPSSRPPTSRRARRHRTRGGRHRWVTRALWPALSFDRDGALAAAGTLIAAVVDAVLDHAFFRADPPKSTGREWFSRDYIDGFIAQCREAGGVRDEDIIATATEFTARSIADQYRRFIPEPIREVVLAGGGAKNPSLVAAIIRALATPHGGARAMALPVVRFDDVYFDGEAKEAVAFALLGYLHLTGRSGNVPSATGARGPRTLGHYTPAA